MILPVPPSSNKYWRVWRNRAVRSKEAEEYIAAARLEWKLQQPSVKMLRGPIAVTLRWYRHEKRGDLDNRIKVALDSLKRLAFLDDAQIVRILAERFEDKARPRLEVEIDAA